VIWGLGNEPFYTCPVNHVTAREYKLLSLYFQYRDGFLLESGGLGSQAAGYVDAMTFLHSIFKGHEAEKLKTPPPPKAQRGPRVGRR